MLSIREQIEDYRKQMARMLSDAADLECRRWRIGFIRAGRQVNRADEAPVRYLQDRDFAEGGRRRVGIGVPSHAHRGEHENLGPRSRRSVLQLGIFSEIALRAGNSAFAYRR